MLKRLRLMVFVIIIITISRIRYVLGYVSNENKLKISVNKCCETNELYLDNKCRHYGEVNETVWVPMFTTKDGKIHNEVHYRY